jgi:hypothetical protein
MFCKTKYFGVLPESSVNVQQMAPKPCKWKGILGRFKTTIFRRLFNIEVMWCRIMGWLMNWKSLGTKRWGLIEVAIIFLEWLRNSMENLSHINRYPGRDSNRKPTEYKSRGLRLVSRPTCSLFAIWYDPEPSQNNILSSQPISLRSILMLSHLLLFIL